MWRLPQAAGIIPPMPEQNRDAAPAKDTLFTDPAFGSTDFKFNEHVAGVFDDMVCRSVPFYEEMQRMTAEIAAEFAVEGTNLYDLGCATGTTLKALDAMLQPGVRFVGVDNSEDMLKKARAKIAERNWKRPVEFVCADLHAANLVENASVAVMILTLQFIRPLYRDRVIQNIAKGMHDQGCLILIEKLTMQDTLFNRLYIKNYYELKRRRGYSEVEISQKREALENVLIPYRYEENRDLLLSNGFSKVEEFFRWYNFCGILAVK
jgi:tRNA (cmo5U34)-methyltransferase